MKNQFFADNRDLFKFDLAQTLKENISQLELIYYIPMLTPNDNKKHGEQTTRSKAKAGYENKKLMKYLDNCIRTGRRDIREIKQCYHSQKIDINIYKETDYFTHGKREEYFRQAIKTIPDNSLVLVDPDNGMEVDRSNEKHIKYDNLKGLYERMNENSVLMIFQFFKRYLAEKEKPMYIHRRQEEIKRYFSHKGKACFIPKDKIVFFLLSKTLAMSKNVSKTIKEYNNTYNETKIN